MFKKLIVLPVALFAFACAKGDNKNVDSALNSDLTTAASARPYTAQDSISAAERSAALAGTGTNPTTTRTVTRTVPGPVRTRTVYRNSPSGSNTTVTTSAPVQHTVVKNTKRDATIGAVAGAVIGATTSKNKVKGGIIGAVAGGVLGGVIGNNVDKKKQ
jgi:uncharacterized protein YcfJ